MLLLPWGLFGYFKVLIRVSGGCTWRCPSISCSLNLKMALVALGLVDLLSFYQSRCCRWRNQPVFPWKEALRKAFALLCATSP